MSTLQLSLLIIVVVVVAGVYLYNLYEERQIRRKIDAPFARHDNVLLEPRAAAHEERREPVLADNEQEPTQPIPAQELPSYVEPTLKIDPSETVAAEPVAAFSVREPVEAPDPQIECVVLLRDIQVSGGDWPRLSAIDLGKPIRWLAREGERWRVLEPDARFTEGAVCILLANRAGPITPEQLDRFYALLEEASGKPWQLESLPARERELARAADVDHRCADLDIQVGLNLLRNSGAALAGTRLRGVAEASGFHLTEHGQFDYVHEETGKLQFTLTNIEPRPLTADNLKVIHTHGITLLLDVPRVADPVRAFDQMRIVAKRLAVTLEATLQDDNRQPLSDAALGTIRGHIQQTAAALRGMHIEPGGSRALRLFS